MKYQVTGRGFGYYKFKDGYNAKCSLQKSSSIYPHIWLGMDEDHRGVKANVGFDNLTQMPIPCRMHLDQKQVYKLIPILQYFVRTGELPEKPDEPVIDPDKPRLFQLNRIEDETGVSGEGIVAQGVQFKNGKCALSWLTEVSSVAVYDSIDDLEKIHGHNGSTVIEWLDAPGDRGGKAND